jgi:hypothetical protein
MKRFLVTAVVAAALTAVAACTDEPASPTVPRLATSAGAGSGTGNNGDSGKADNPNAVSGDGSAGRRSKLHAAADCIRQHGAPNYQDPLLTADGYVYTDDVALRGLEEPQLEAIQTACRDLIRAASFSMQDQGPPPPKLIQAGVRSAQCLRANGLPDFKDPTADSRFSPGKGFGLGGSAIPPGGKENPAVKRALTACRQILDEEAALSSLGNLGDA